ncbi:hypothetical protein [Pseudoalteromonas sp. 1_2015MBL_MicDiv]|uniref:hypothetical protein n=1 Tax=Pseudoalteromonas sp. 1_2015MBL_MicDiv TaxID=1720343 RepID=UPI000BBE4992|nr:hypothetical protein [Pseudoalteromonas sp. 1_2015MBL_MicDiv]ATG80051.1 hypothetical protein AOR04_21230 [Pseudoalteromonas sp. 1_2015MBL_MicDiv]
MTEKTTLCNFRVNSKLKNDFSELCKSNHSNISNELRGFINRSVLSGRLDYDSSSLATYGKSSSHSQASKGAAALRNAYKFKQQAQDEQPMVEPDTSDSTYQEDFDLDSNCNFKLDTELKEGFLKFFPNTKLSAELKRFMSHIVRTSK